ncbi:TolC family protein [Mariniblastus sp.]|nr:TolC family protein [Mariniblastus sp.]
MWVGLAHTAGSDSDGQVWIGRYPLHAPAEHAPTVHAPTVHAPVVRAATVQAEAQPSELGSTLEASSNAEPSGTALTPHTTLSVFENVAEAATQSSIPPSKLSNSLEATRAKFAKHFEQAYAGVATSLSANAMDLESAEPTKRSAHSVKHGLPSEHLANQIQRPENVARIGTEQPLVTLLPTFSDATAPSSGVIHTQVNWNVSPSPNGYPLGSVPSPDLGDQPTADGSEPLTWWNSLVVQPLHPENQVQSIDSNGLVYTALQNSPRIQGLSRDPLIRDFEVIEAESTFDPVSFLQSQFADRSDPIGGALDATRDGLSTIENHRWTAEGGVRKRARTGATYELSQRLGFENSNVSVFDPNNQGTAQLALNVTQPLARGRGRYINQSQILIAQSRGGAAWESFAADLQEEIEEVVMAYWRLYFERSVFLQQKRNVERAVEILETLEGRANLDSLPSQITRARSSVQTRKTELANAFRDIRNTETELRRLTADRNWRSNQFVELLPMEPPANAALDISLDHVVTTSLENRPEIRATIQEAKLAGIERDISVNDLLPELSLLLGTYVSTLEGNSRVGDAFVDQFGQTKPGYSVGLEFELPIGNRLARSRLIQRKLQLARIRNQVDETIQNVIAESQTALRRLDSAGQTFAAANQAIEAARSDLEQNIRRWENFALVEGDFSDGQTPTTVLDQLLDSQERLSSAEMIAAQSQLELKLAEVALQRAMGTLLIQRNINPRRAFESGTPQIRF